MNGQPVPFELAIGRVNSTTGSAPTRRIIMLQFELWPTSGFASSSAAGVIASPTPTNAMNKRSAREPLRPSQFHPIPKWISASSGNLVEVFPNPQNFPLDRVTQKSYGHGPSGAVHET